MRGVWIFAAVAGCTFIDEADHHSRLDQDQDGYPYPQDCNDNDSQMQALVGWDGGIGCGDEVLLSAADAQDHVSVLECQEADDANNQGTAKMQGAEQVWGFASDVSTDVELRMEAGEFVHWVAFRGRFCDDLCVSGGGDLLYFRAEAHEMWHIVATPTDTDRMFIVDCLADLPTQPEP